VICVHTTYLYIRSPIAQHVPSSTFGRIFHLPSLSSHWFLESPGCLPPSPSSSYLAPPSCPARPGSDRCPPPVPPPPQRFYTSRHYRPQQTITSTLGVTVGVNPPPLPLRTTTPHSSSPVPPPPIRIRTTKNPSRKMGSPYF
jgi:hypothetical protein